MRLAVFTSQFPSRFSTFFARDIRGLLAAGIDVDVFSMYPMDPTLWRYVPHILDEHFLPRDKVHHLGLRDAVRLPTNGTFPRFLVFLRDAAAVSASAARFGVVPVVKSAYVLIKGWAWAQEYSSRYDHILAYWGNYAATCGYVFNRVGGKRVPFSMFLHAGADLYYRQTYMCEKLLDADNIIVVCDFNREFVRKTYPEIFPLISHKMHVYHPGLDFSEFPYVPDGRPLKQLVAVGRFDRTKGFDYLIHAVRELVIRGIDVDLELVGDGDEAAALHRLSRRLGISDRVKFRGWLRSDEVKAVMKQSTILAHPSAVLDDAVPTVIKEAMALGTPVVASALAGIPELLDNGRCGKLVPPRNVPLLADALQVLLEDTVLRSRYAAAARKYAEEKFDLWKNGQGLADLLTAHHSTVILSSDS